MSDLCDGCIWFASGENEGDGVWVADQCQDCHHSNEFPDNWTPTGCLWIQEEVEL